MPFNHAWIPLQAA
jgi:hypothetical protein